MKNYVNIIQTIFVQKSVAVMILTACWLFSHATGHAAVVCDCCKKEGQKSGQVEAALTLPDTSLHPECKFCGMYRTYYTHSRMLVTYDDGTTVGTCSLHCLVKEMKENGNRPMKSLQVADYGTKELLDAKTATWVIGGKKNGVMTPVAKWAFARAEDAREFIRENGGRLATFEEALQMAFKEDE